MSRPQGNGIVELHDDSRKEYGFFCMELAMYLTDEGKTDWDQWHGAFQLAAAGHCPYIATCNRYKRTMKKKMKNGVQLEFDYETKQKVPENQKA